MALDAIRSAAIGRVVEPRATTQNADGVIFISRHIQRQGAGIYRAAFFVCTKRIAAKSWRHRVKLRDIGIKTPLPHIAVHIVQTVAIAR